MLLQTVLQYLLIGQNMTIDGWSEQHWLSLHYGSCLWVEYIK